MLFSAIDEPQPKKIVMSINTKPWYRSKTIWFNITMTLFDTVSLAQIMVESLSRQYPDPRWVIIVFVLTFLHGFGNIILRYWFTSQRLQRITLGENNAKQSDQE